MLGATMEENADPHIYYEQLRNYQMAMLLFEALQLDIFSYLAVPSTAEEVASRVGYHVQNTKLLLLALHSCGYIHKRGTTYSNTAAAHRYLVRTSPLYLGSALLFRRDMTSLHGIGEKVRNGLGSKDAVTYDFTTLAQVTVPEMYAKGRV